MMGPRLKMDICHFYTLVLYELTAVKVAFVKMEAVRVTFIEVATVKVIAAKMTID